MTLSVDFAAVPDSERAAQAGRLCDAMEEADGAGRYPPSWPAGVMNPHPLRSM